MPPTDVVVVSYNTCDHLRRCLRSVLSDDPGGVVVVDNGSTDGSIDMVRSEFPAVRLVIDERNRGYGAAANLGIRACGGEYVVLLNSDTVLAPGTLAALREYLTAHPRVGIAGPRLRNADGTLQPSCAPFLGTFRLTLEKTPAARLLRRIPAVRDHYLLLHSPHDRARAVPWVMGAVLAIRRRAFAGIGGFDETFFMYAEEVDLCYRMHQAGWDVHFAPVADVVHVGGASTSLFRPEMMLRRSESALHFYRRHYSPVRVRVLTFLISSATRARLWRSWVGGRLGIGSPSKRCEEMRVYRDLLESIARVEGRPEGAGASLARSGPGDSA